jgi:hypothetical protein
VMAETASPDRANLCSARRAECDFSLNFPGQRGNSGSHRKVFGLGVVEDDGGG